MVQFIEAMKKAKKGYPKQDRWRVVEHHHEFEYVTMGGSTIALEKDGNICGLCRNVSDRLCGEMLLDLAIQMGGTKTQAFGRKLYEFYTKNGFYPVSWIKFNYDKIKIKGWNKKYEKEPLIFYAYWQTKKAESYDEFIMSTNPSRTEKSAYKNRDKWIEIMKRIKK